MQKSTIKKTFVLCARPLGRQLSRPFGPSLRWRKESHRVFHVVLLHARFGFYLPLERRENPFFPIAFWARFLVLQDDKLQPKSGMFCVILDREKDQNFFFCVIFFSINKVNRSNKNNNPRVVVQVDPIFINIKACSIVNPIATTINSHEWLSSVLEIKSYCSH